MMIAFALVLIGVSFLGLSLGLISAETFSIMWPLALVIFGIWMMMNGPYEFRKGKKKK